MARAGCVEEAYSPSGPHPTARRAAPDMAAMAAEELTRIDAALPDAGRALELALLPKDDADPRPAIMEIRAGAGGEEAALFAADLMRMYQRHADEHGRTMDGT